jgi:acyl transferase domain-containing protein
MAEAYRALMAVEENSPALQDLCYTASVRRTHHDHRLALVVHSRDELAEYLEAFLQGENRPGMLSGRRIAGHRPRLAFVFPGQGSQWVGMARELMQQEPIFREALASCDQTIRRYADRSLLEELTAEDPRSRLEELDVVQPAIFAVQVALATLWRSWGIEPNAVVGHSMGEVAAAHIAGILGLDDAVRIMCRRSRVVRQRASGKGGMAVVELPAEEVEGLLASYGGCLVVASCNSPTTTVVSGDLGALQSLRHAVERQGIFFPMVKVDYASHSPQMDALQGELLEALDSIQPRRASVPMLSTVTASFLEGHECDTSYWVDNIRKPVRFAQAIDCLMREGYGVFLEVSPHPILSAAISQCLRHRGQEGVVLPSLRRGEEERAMMLGSLGALYTLGYPVDWTRIYPSGGRCIGLPSYPWQRERFWLETIDGDARERSAGRRRRKGHGLLDQHLKSAVHSGMHFWEMDLSTQLFRYLDDHRIQGLSVLPAAAYVEMALAAAEEAFGVGPHVLEKVTFKKALFLPENGSQTVQLVVSPQSIGEASFQFFSLAAGVGQEQTAWTLHATGTIRLGQTSRVVSTPKHESPEELQARCPEVISGADFYNTNFS